jgi:DNA-binding response OmpR family regulator
MAGRRDFTVLLVEEHDDTRALYVAAMTDAGCVVRAIASADDAVAIAVAEPIDVAVLDIDFDGFAVAEQLAALRNRPRLIAVTARTPTGAPVEKLFDSYVVKPCLPETLVDALRAVARLPTRSRDLLIVARDRVGIDDVLQRFGDETPQVEVRLDLRRRERRRTPHAEPVEERRRHDRRAFGVTDQLRMEGWAFIPAAQRV